MDVLGQVHHWKPVAGRDALLRVSFVSTSGGAVDFTGMSFQSGVKLSLSDTIVLCSPSVSIVEDETDTLDVTLSQEDMGLLSPGELYYFDVTAYSDDEATVVLRGRILLQDMTGTLPSPS